MKKENYLPLSACMLVLVSSIIILQISMISLVKTINYVVLICFLSILGYVDFKRKIVSNKMLILMIIVRCLLLMFELIKSNEIEFDVLLGSFIGATLGFSIFLIARMLSKSSIGMGDVKLMGVIGFYVGIEELFFIALVSLLMLAIVGIILILLKKINYRDTIAYVPFVMISTLLLTFLIVT